MAAIPRSSFLILLVAFVALVVTTTFATLSLAASRGDDLADGCGGTHADVYFGGFLAAGECHIDDAGLEQSFLSYARRRLSSHL
jgi:hypothetical protein